MENNPYKSDYHNYLESLKSDLEKSDSYVNANPELQYSNTVNYSKSINRNNILKYSLMAISAMIVGVSVVSFLTQGVLLVINKNSNIDGDVVVKNQISPEQKSVEDELKKLYVRADIGKAIFGSTTEATTTLAKKETFDISKYFNVNIPGVSRIGYIEDFGNQFLTDNINKYSDKTLVIGDRNNPDQMNPGGEEDVSLQDKYDLTPKPYIPVLSSRAYIIADLDSGEVILEKNSDTIYPIASVSKLMTSTIATEKMNLQDVAIVSRDATNAYGAQGSLALGEKIRLSDLVYPLLMESSNDAAEVFADHYGHQEFMDEMNKKAAFLEMNDTYYNDPSGLDPKNSSTPSDLVKLVRYIWKHDPTIFDTTRVKQFAIKGHTWLNRNPQLLVTGYIGGKNGYIDQALQTTASIFEIPLIKGGTRKVVIVVLKSNDKNGDVLKLIKFMKNSVVYTP